MVGGDMGPRSGGFCCDWPAGAVIGLCPVSEYSCNWPISAHLNQSFVFSSRAVYRLCTFSPTTYLTTDILQAYSALRSRS